MVSTLIEQYPRSFFVQGLHFKEGHALIIDNVRLMVEGENNRSRMYFGRCIAFFEDANDQLFIYI